MKMHGLLSVQRGMQRSWHGTLLFFEQTYHAFNVQEIQPSVKEKWGFFDIEFFYKSNMEKGACMRLFFFRMSLRSNL